MCQWYCTSEGPFTNLHCLHCHVRYCGACLHGEAGKMESLVKCAGCGKKPRIKANSTRRAWGGEVRSPQGTSKTVLRPPQRGQHSQAAWAAKEAESGNFSWDAVPTHRSIFDKLTDTSLYTGSHRHRFDEHGQGRGLEGRDSIGKGMGTGAVLAYYGEGPVVSIAQLVRNDKLDPQHMNKIRRLPDGSTVLSPGNRGVKSADGKWRPERNTPAGSPTHARSMSGSQSARSLRSPSFGGGHVRSGSSASSSSSFAAAASAAAAAGPSGGGLTPHPHDINFITSQGRGLYGGNFAQDGQYAPQQRGPVGPYAVGGSKQQQQQQQPHSARQHYQQPASSSASSGGGGHYQLSPQQLYQLQQEHMQLQQQQQQYDSYDGAPQSARGGATGASAGGFPSDPPMYPFEGIRRSAPSSAASSSSRHPQRPASASYQSSPIFDKLTDPSLYTGAHRQRFDEETGYKGKGLKGRMDIPKERFQGDVYQNENIMDLSQITRQQYNMGSPASKIQGFKY